MNKRTLLLAIILVGAVSASYADFDGQATELAEGVIKASGGENWLRVG